MPFYHSPVSSLCIFASVYHAVYISYVSLCLCLFVSGSHSVCLCLSVSLPLCLFISLFALLGNCLSVSLPLCRPLSFPVYVSQSFAVSHFLSLYLPLYLPHFSPLSFRLSMSSSILLVLCISCCWPHYVAFIPHLVTTGVTHVNRKTGASILYRNPSLMGEDHISCIHCTSNQLLVSLAAKGMPASGRR